MSSCINDSVLWAKCCTLLINSVQEVRAEASRWWIAFRLRTLSSQFKRFDSQASCTALRTASGWWDLLHLDISWRERERKKGPESWWGVNETLKACFLVLHGGPISVQMFFRGGALNGLSAPTRITQYFDTLKSVSLPVPQDENKTDVLECHWKRSGLGPIGDFHHAFLVVTSVIQQ